MSLTNSLAAWQNNRIYKNILADLTVEEIVYFFQLKHRNKISYRIISIAVLKANVRGWQRTAGQFSQTVLAVNETEERLP